LREQLFARVDQAMIAANEALANVLAPESYADAARFYRNAENNLQRGRSLEDIRADLVAAVRNFDAVVKASELARVTFPDAIAARARCRRGAVRIRAMKFK